MKVVILAGGLGTRISEETVNKPKPMVEIGGRPILWHIMKIYSSYGFNDFVICVGYRGYQIKEYFANYVLHNSNITVDLGNKNLSVHDGNREPWKVTLIDTGEQTMTGGRIKRIREQIGDEDFCLTYGDGVADVNIANLVKYHKEHGRMATVTAVLPPSRFGALNLEGDVVRGFIEKPKEGSGWINGGFFVLKKGVFDLIEDDGTVWEQQPLQRLSEMGHLRAFKHSGFWQPMDTLREKNLLEDLWSKESPPWKVW